MTTEKLLNLAPEDILIRDNVRFSLKPYRVESLANNILKVGGVQEPILVEELEKPIDGKKYALQVGNYRTAAVSKLNSEQNAGLTLPCRVVPALSDADRYLAQVAENQERENMSPMDKAIAIQKMISAGISKMDVRSAFASAGGRKGIKVQPASNSHINMLMSFLDFPKDIQKKIHDGIIGVGAAYKLTKLPKDKWDAVLESAETERIKDIDREEKEEETYLAQTKKAEEAEQEHTKVTTELEKVKAAAESAKSIIEDKTKAVLEATQARLAAKGEERKLATEHLKAVNQELDAAKGIADKATKELAKLTEKASTTAEKAQAAKDRLEAARKAKLEKSAGKSKTVTGKDVDKAAKKVAGTGSTKLNATEMRDAIKSLTVLSKPQSNYPLTMQVGALIEQCFDGKITDAQLQVGIARIVGEAAAAKTKK